MNFRTADYCCVRLAEAPLQADRWAATGGGLDRRFLLRNADLKAAEPIEVEYPPMIEAARRRGYDSSARRARQVTRADFGRFHLILAADPPRASPVSRRCARSAMPRP